MMGIGVVPVLVREGPVHMSVQVRLARLGTGSMSMLVMLVVNVAVLMLERRMNVAMPMEIGRAHV